jgi:hypothetical protein
MFSFSFSNVFLCILLSFRSVIAKCHSIAALASRQEIVLSISTDYSGKFVAGRALISLHQLVMKSPQKIKSCGTPFLQLKRICNDAIRTRTDDGGFMPTTPHKNFLSGTAPSSMGGGQNIRSIAYKRSNHFTSRHWLIRKEDVSLRSLANSLLIWKESSPIFFVSISLSLGQSLTQSVLQPMIPILVHDVTAEQVLDADLVHVKCLFHYLLNSLGRVERSLERAEPQRRRVADDAP